MAHTGLLNFHKDETVFKQSLKIDLMANWIETDWMTQFPDKAFDIALYPMHFVDNEILSLFNQTQVFSNQYVFHGYTVLDCPIIPQVNEYDREGVLKRRTGAFLYEFIQQDKKELISILVLSTYIDDEYQDKISIACVPREHIQMWIDFVKETWRLPLSPRVEIIGGTTDTFEPKVDWEEVVLPAELKTSIFEDVQSFFTKGVDVYKRLNLKPFRKLLLAGVPGTGKTMLCTALAKWALDHDYLVIYVSSADHEGATFRKIQQALVVASRSNHPTLIILEELDAYLHDREKAMVLNTLDGSESLENEKGTLLVATTNYPEAIDHRVLKRPGRLDRIFIIPETQNNEDAEQMLQQYLGIMWQEEHRAIAQRLVGFPGAFIREVAIYALTQIAYDDLTDLSAEILQESFNRLKEQIDVKDEFLKKRADIGFGSKP